MNDLDKNKGYLEIRIGKKYQMSVPESAESKEHKPGIINYSFFYGVPIQRLIIEKNAKEEVTSIEFIFDHKNDPIIQKENSELLMEILGKPSHTYQPEKNPEEEIKLWFGRKIELEAHEKNSDSLDPEALRLIIKKK